MEDLFAKAEHVFVLIYNLVAPLPGSVYMASLEPGTGGPNCRSICRRKRRIAEASRQFNSILVLIQRPVSGG